jgi:hypothetical protein
MSRVVTVVALIASVVGCAGPSASPEPSGGSASVGELAGQWRGYYSQTSAGDTGYVHGDIDLRINDDGTYKGTWSNRQVAGSTRAGQSGMQGIVRVTGNRVILEDWRQLILKRRGNMLYGLTIDPGTARTLSVYLERVP